ncbi:hypothetical protein GQ457_04G021640 [Hibiscus cannabinus]
MEKFDLLFSPDEVDMIRSIPFGGPTVKEVLVWSGSKDGEYTAKSFYFLLSFVLEEVSKPEMSDDRKDLSLLWKGLWGLNVPPKIHAAYCLKVLIIFYSFTHMRKSSGENPFFSYSPSAIGCSDNLVEVWQATKRSFVEFLAAKNDPLKTFMIRSRETHCWTPSNGGKVKINCEAAFDRDTCQASTTTIVKDSCGHALGGKSSSFMASSTSSTEGYAVRLGTILALKEGYVNAIIESDNLGVINRLNNRNLGAWVSTTIEEDILFMCLSYPSISFSFVHRSVNCVAD